MCRRYLWRRELGRSHVLAPRQVLSCPCLLARPPYTVTQNERLAACGERREAGPPRRVGSGASTQQRRDRRLGAARGAAVGAVILPTMGTCACRGASALVCLGTIRGDGLGHA